MIELEKALELAGRYPVPSGMNTIPLPDSLGRVLGEDLFSDRDVPPFPKATMDGYACRRSDLPGPLEVLETVYAGSLPKFSVGPGQCSRIMTGSMVPEGTNCVIMQEYVSHVQQGRILFSATETDINIDQRGSELKEGDLLVQKGTRLHSGHLGIIASAGIIKVKVFRSLKIGILASGSELVDAGTKPEGASIRNANSYHLSGQVRTTGNIPVDLGIVKDERNLLAGMVSTAVEEVDLLILTGGASAGELDLVPGVLEELGFRIEFNRVAIQPGKPVSFAHGQGRTCFGLSGNPVSCFVQFEMLVRPFLDICSGALPVKRRFRVPMEKEFRRKHADRLFFLPFSLTDRGTCEPVNYLGSGHLHSLDKVAGFVEVPIGQTGVGRGDLVNAWLI